MKRFTSLPVHKIIFWICFLPWLLFIFLYELWFTKIPSHSDTLYKLGIIFSRIGYSIVSASIFYFVSQYIGTFIPREQKKIKILPMIHRNALSIDNEIRLLKINLDYENEDSKNIDNLRQALNSINPNSSIDRFENWYQYLFNLKLQLLDLIRSMTFYNDYLSRDFFQELIIIEQRLMSPITFAGSVILNVSNLSFADIDLQELMIHNDHLQLLRKEEFKKYEKAFEKDGNVYRKVFYKESDKK